MRCQLAKGIPRALLHWPPSPHKMAQQKPNNFLSILFPEPYFDPKNEGLFLPLQSPIIMKTKLNI